MSKDTKHRVKMMLAVISGPILLLIVTAFLPTYTPVERTSASQSSEITTDCPADTDKGTYFVRGHDKQGNVICGFAYFNPCPYYEGAEAGTPECEKGKPTEEQMQPWNPEEPAQPIKQPTTDSNTNQCGGK